MSWGAVAAVGASVVGGAIASKGAKDAAKASGNASMAAIDENRRQFDVSSLVNVLMNAPSINTGNVARSQLAGMLGLEVPGMEWANQNLDDLPPGLADALRQIQMPGSTAANGGDVMARLEATPGFAFMRDQGVKSVLSNARALGLGKSGVAMGDVTDRVTNGVAMPFYSDYMNRLGGLAGAGTNVSQSTAANIGNAATNSGAMNAGLMQNAGDARASGILGQAGAWNGALNQLGAIAGDWAGGQGGVPTASDGKKYWGMQF